MLEQRFSRVRLRSSRVKNRAAVQQQISGVTWPLLAAAQKGSATLEGQWAE